LRAPFNYTLSVHTNLSIFSFISTVRSSTRSTLFCIPRNISNKIDKLFVMRSDKCELKSENQIFQDQKSKNFKKKYSHVTMGIYILLAACQQKFGTIQLVFRALALTPSYRTRPSYSAIKTTPKPLRLVSRKFEKK